MSDAGDEIGTSGSITTEDTSSNSKTTEDTSSGSKTTEDLQGPDNLCNICYGAVKQPVKIRGCLHEFDWECIEKWIYGIGNRLCPMCRGEICHKDPYTPDSPQTRPPIGRLPWQNMEPGSEERRQEYIRFMSEDPVHLHYFSEEALRHRPGARAEYLRWLEETSYYHLHDEPPVADDMLPGSLILGSLDVDDLLPETDYGEDSDNSPETSGTNEEIEDKPEEDEEYGVDVDGGFDIESVGRVVGPDHDYMDTDHNDDPDNEDGDLLIMLMAGL